MIRTFDLILSLVLLTLLLPFFAVIAIAILLDDGLPVLFIQKRIGKNGQEFNLFKFRSMRKNADQLGQLTVGERDPRILKSGFFIRKYKLDELPQIFNVINGTMSVVGPRPEVKEFVDLYSEEQRRVLQVRPGITDLASIKFRNENEILAKSSNSRQTYIDQIMPEKIRLNMDYIDNKSVSKYFSVIFATFRAILRE